MGNYQRSRSKDDAAKVDKFLDNLRQGMEDYAPPKPARPTLTQFALSVAFLTAQVLFGAVVVGVALRIVFAVAGL